MKQINLLFHYKLASNKRENLFFHNARSAAKSIMFLYTRFFKSWVLFAVCFVDRKKKSTYFSF